MKLRCGWASGQSPPWRQAGLRSGMQLSISDDGPSTPPTEQERLSDAGPAWPFLFHAPAA